MRIYTTMKATRTWKAVLGWGTLAATLFVLGACRQKEGPVAEAVAPERAQSDAGLPSLAPKPEEGSARAVPPSAAVPLNHSATAEQTAGKPAQGTVEDEVPPENEYDPQEVVPLVSDPQQLQRLHPSYPVWFDKSQRRVVITGQVCAREAPLEMFACPRGTKEHEAIVAVDTKPYVVHAGLVAAGADPGNPVQFYPEYTPASGPEIDITVVWEDEKGQRRVARAQEWIRHAETGKVMEHPWVFTGSNFTKDEQTGEEYYQADGGDFICVSNFPSAMLDLPIKSSDSNASLMFRAYTERIPPLGTPVTLILKPNVQQATSEQDS